MSGERKLLILSPAFPPANAADMHRVRMSLPYWKRFGWSPAVLCVASKETGYPLDALLCETVPRDVPVTEVAPIALAATRWAGITNLGLRSFRALLLKGREILSREKFDLVFISTTTFFSMPLGRIWKKEFGVPFVIDLQDPWASVNGAMRPGMKHAVVAAMHRRLEKWTMKAVDGIVSVTPAYNVTMLARYPALSAKRLLAEPFAASAEDIAVADRSALPNPYFDPADGLVHGVFTGVLGEPKARICRAICEALRSGLRDDREAFQRVRLHFVGTTYASDERARPSIVPIAKELAVDRLVTEEPRRISYFQSIKVLRQAHFGILLGSEEKEYLPSKLFLYLMAGRPILAIVNATSKAADVLRENQARNVVTFSDDTDVTTLAQKIRVQLGELIRDHQASFSSNAGSTHSAEQMTQRLASFFDSVVEHA